MKDTKKKASMKDTKKKVSSRFGPPPKLVRTAYFAGSSDDFFGHGFGGPSPSGPHYEMMPPNYHRFFEELEAVTSKQAEKCMDKPLKKKDSNKVVQWYKHVLGSTGWLKPIVRIYGKSYNHRVYRYVSDEKTGKYAELDYYGTDFAH